MFDISTKYSHILGISIAKIKMQSALFHISKSKKELSIRQKTVNNFKNKTFQDDFFRKNFTE